MKERHRHGSLLLYFWGVGMICSTIAGGLAVRRAHGPDTNRDDRLDSVDFVKGGSMMKRFDRMTLAELQAYHAIAKREIHRRDGMIFAEGTRFEIQDKWRGLALHEIGAQGLRGITRVRYDDLEFVPKPEEVAWTQTN